LDSLNISENTASAAAANAAAVTASTSSSTSSTESTTTAVNAVIAAASINPQLYAMLSAHQALQWQQQQQQHRSNPANQPYATGNDRQQMIATNQAVTAMQNCHNLNTNSNGSCSSCRELKRELEYLRRIVAKLMENKPDLLCATPPLFGLSPPQRSVVPPQSFITDSPFLNPVMQNLPRQILQQLYAAALTPTNPASMHSLQVEHNWPAAVAAAAAAASTSGNTTDLAQNATSVENNGNFFIEVFLDR
jgi:hypothetical protein